MNSQAPLAPPSIPPSLSPGLWQAIIPVMGLMTVFAAAQGLTYPLLALLLKEQGYSEILIGLNAAMTPIGLMLSAAFITDVAQRVGAWRLSITAMVLLILVYLSLGLFRSYEAWLVLRFVLGLAVNCLFVISETWVNQLAPSHLRGRIMGVYVMVVSVGFAVGPLVLGFVGTAGWAPFLVGIILPVFAIGGLTYARPLLPAMKPDDDGERGSLLKFARLAPKLLIAVGVMALFEQSVMSFLPIYGLSYGLSESAVTFALTVLIMGTVFWQYPVGWLESYVPSWVLMLTVALITVAGSLILPFVITDPVWVWPVIFIWGGTAFASYTLALIELGNRFTGAMLLAGNAAFSMMWGVGGVIGPPIVGGAMSTFGVDALPVLTAIFYVAFALVVVFRRRGKVHQETSPATVSAG